MLAGDADALFTVLNNSTPVQTLRRLDPETGQVVATRRGTHIAGSAALLAGKLWVIVTYRRGASLQALDPHSLATRSSIKRIGAVRVRDASIIGAVARTGRIYLGYNSNRVAVIDATSGRVRRHYVIRGGEVSAAVDPSGTRMYVVTTATGGDIQSQALTVRDPGSGTVLVTSDYRPPIAPGTIGVVAASRGGVWISEGSGMTYRVAFHPADAVASTAHANGESSGGFPLTVTNAPPVVWVGSETRLLCADPGTGAVRASARPGRNGIVDITQAGSRTFADYFTDGSRRLVTLTPPHACFA